MSHKADYKKAELQIDTLIHQMHMKGETAARLRKLRSLEAKRDKALERWARTEAWKPSGNPSFTVGKRGRWVNASGFKVSTRRRNGKSYTVVEFRPPKSKNPRSLIRAGPLKKRKVARRVGAALRKFVGRSNSRGRSRRR